MSTQANNNTVLDFEIKKNHCQPVLNEEEKPLLRFISFRQQLNIQNIDLDSQRAMT